MVIIKDVLESSFIDYPKKISLVIFTAGCNFRCHYCHNPELVEPELPFMSEEKTLKKIESKKDWIDGVVITGGEPTLHADLPEFIKKIKEMGLMVKLDTNGTNPEMIRKLMEEELIDYIAMDVKAPLEEYSKVTSVKIDESLIKKSIELIKNSGIEYEFRTTILPKLLKEEDIIKIGYLLNGAKLLALQTFKNKKTLDSEYKTQKSYLQPQMEHFSRVIKPFVKTVITR
ncbi:MAG: anaerobic ribonucleoside-triphosphate reductase activating protein [Candidatus Nanoarchaeia archaeon]|nr:anaerobic ribonucleoside-triphosphate reductase activating protein [Candidatus Nanoarchaeia archaeon]MDD5053826.1 anaerobic ribonucleoside-triphosphate reductase activating protein [Candidatus Nanoarchaeia archaeon]MDD5499511.1 anaerobic ribonucleoside-triphosphate reductase activating protein [Candidatus Nanoarchaeia archaeon]